MTLGQLFSYAFPTNEHILTFSSFVSCCIFRFISSYSPYIFFLTFSRVALTWCQKNQMPFSNLLMILFTVGLNCFFSTSFIITFHQQQFTLKNKTRTYISRLVYIRIIGIKCLQVILNFSVHT